MPWNSVATGKLPDKHEIHGFIESDPVNAVRVRTRAHHGKAKRFGIFLRSAGCVLISLAGGQVIRQSRLRTQL